MAFALSILLFKFRPQGLTNNVNQLTHLYPFFHLRWRLLDILRLTTPEAHGKRKHSVIRSTSYSEPGRP